MIPKFKVWLKDRKEMVDAYSINFVEETVQWIEKTIYIRTEGFENIILIQSTGLTDKNGVEIFESDIVKVSQDDDYFISFVKNMIEYDCPGFDVRTPENWDYECNVLSHVMNTDQTIELLGNIYEHADLLN